jgi:12-oxophytodienoic acid reductase
LEREHLWYNGIYAFIVSHQLPFHAPNSNTDNPVTPQVSYFGNIDDLPPAAPQRLETVEIVQIVEDFRVAARNAIKAGNISPSNY